MIHMKSLFFNTAEVLMCDTAALCPNWILDTEPKFHLRQSI